MLVACMRGPRPLDIRSDSEWVVDGVADLKSTGKMRDAHQDLWSMLQNEIQLRSTEVSVSWVKGHAKEADIQRGRTTREDKLGNDGADGLAVAGAASHGVPLDIVNAAKRKRFMAINVHKFMLDVLMQRRAQEHEATSGGDRGSDMADDFFDCTELTLDDDIDIGEDVLSGVS